MISELEVLKEPEENVRDMATDLHEATASTVISNEGIKLCLHSYCIHAILTGKEGDYDMQKYEGLNNLNCEILNRKMSLIVLLPF